MIRDYHYIIYLLFYSFSWGAPICPPVGNWINNNVNFLAYLARNPYPLCEWPEKFESGQRQLYLYDITNHSSNNYVFQIPGMNYWIKISGPKHRVRNLYTYNTGKNSYDYTQIALHWELRNPVMLNAFELVPTYQTISRYANYMLRAQIIEQEQLTHIRMPITYLVHIPSYDTQLSDEHYVIVQEHIEGIERLYDAPHRVIDVPGQAIKELYSLICKTGIWNIRYGLWLDENNNFVLIDHEQRNIENPDNFFNKDPEAFEQCVFTGIKQLANVHLRPHDPTKYQLLLWLIATDTNLHASFLWEKYITLLG